MMILKTIVLLFVVFLFMLTSIIWFVGTSQVYKSKNVPIFTLISETPQLFFINGTIYNTTKLEFNVTEFIGWNSTNGNFNLKCQFGGIEIPITKIKIPKNQNSVVILNPNVVGVNITFIDLFHTVLDSNQNSWVVFHYNVDNPMIKLWNGYTKEQDYFVLLLLFSFYISLFVVFDLFLTGLKSKFGQQLT